MKSALKIRPEYKRIISFLIAFILVSFLNACDLEAPPENTVGQVIVTPEPTFTSTPLSTPTAVVTSEPTLASILSATLTAEPPTPQIELQPELQEQTLPNINYDLVFLSDGNLKLLNHEDNEIENLLDGGIVKYSLSEDGRKLIAAQQVNTEPNEYDLVLVDPDAKTSQILVKGIRCLHDFEISPDGKSLLYIADTWNSVEQACQIKVELGSGVSFYSFYAPFPHKSGGTISVISVNDPSAVITVGRCEGVKSLEDDASPLSLCVGAFWTPDSQQIIWFDAEGIWQTNLQGSSPFKLYPNSQEDSNRLYQFIAWSRTGNYLMIREWEFRFLILNRQTGTVIEAPYGNYGERGARPYVIWLENDSIFYTKPLAIAERWQIQEQNTLVMQEMAHLASNDSEFIAASPYQLPDGRITYALVSPYVENDEEHGLYLIEALGSTPQKLVDLPPIGNYASNVFVQWSPNGKDAVINYWNYAVKDDGGNEIKFHFVSEPFETLHDITNLLGETAEDLQWLP